MSYPVRSGVSKHRIASLELQCLIAWEAVARHSVPCFYPRIRRQIKRSVATEGPQGIALPGPTREGRQGNASAPGNSTDIEYNSNTLSTTPPSIHHSNCHFPSRVCEPTSRCQLIVSCSSNVIGIFIAPGRHIHHDFQPGRGSKTRRDLRDHHVTETAEIGRSHPLLPAPSLVNAVLQPPT